MNSGTRVVDSNRLNAGRCRCFERQYGDKPTLRSPFPGRDITTVDVGDLLGTAITHHQFQFPLQDLEHALDAGLAECTKAPELRPADADTFGAQRERLEDIRAATNAAVEKDRNPIAHGSD